MEELARAQKKAGDLLQQTPVAVEIRLAEAAAAAVSAGKTSMVIAPDASMATLMNMIGAASRISGAKVRDPSNPEQAALTLRCPVGSA